MNSIKVMCVYIGNFPPYFDTVKKSMLFNKTVDWCIFTDTVTEEIIDGNLKLIPYSMEKYNSRLSEMFSKTIKLIRPYKIADTKPLYALAFPEQVKGYDWWGFCDLDVVFGNIRRFLTDEILNNNEAISYITAPSFITREPTIHGPFSLFKNRKDIVDMALDIDYKSILNHEYVGVDEIDFYKVMQNRGIKICTGVYTKSGKKMNFIRYGKRRTPARWVNGDLLMDTYTEDYNNKFFDSYKNESMLIHLRVKKGYTIKNDVIYSTNVDGDIFEEDNTTIINNECEYETNKVNTIENACIISKSSNIDNYYHVLLEYLPSIMVYLRNKKPKDVNLYFQDFSNPDKFNLLKEVIYYFYGIYPNIINECNNIKNIKFLNSVVILKTKRINGFSKIDFETIRDSLLLKNTSVKTYDRILIKRSNRFIPQDIVDYLIHDHGFKQLDMENFNLVDQAHLFNKANIIIGAHGAGLTSMLYCKDGAKVIEINAGYNCGCYPHLRDEILYKTENVNIDFYSIFGDSTNKSLRRLTFPDGYSFTRYKDIIKFVQEPLKFNYIFKTSHNKYSYIPEIGFQEVSKNDDICLDLNRFKETFEEIVKSIL